MTIRNVPTPLPLFDANCRLGPSETTPDGAPVTPDTLLAEMDRLGIAEALVFHSFAAGYAPAFGNTRLMEELRGRTRLHACWVVMPHHTGEMPEPGALVGAMSAAGVRAARMLPRRHRFSLDEWSVDPLAAELAAHRIPLFLDCDRTHWAEDAVDYTRLARLCRAFPELPVILVREGFGSTRYLYPLLEGCDNLHLEISYYQTSGGLADIARRFGPRRLLFGTGLPDYSAGPPLAMLQFAELNTEARCAVAGGNLRTLLAGVR